MNAHDIYKQQQAVGWTRIDMLLALYDGAIERTEKARDAIARGDRSAAVAPLLRAQRIVAELFAGLDLGYGELPRDLQRLYVFVLRSITQGTPEHLGAALDVLRTLREGLAGIRSEAVELERSGAIPPADIERGLQATA